MSVVVKSLGTVTIDIEACKGCWICVDECPVDVLEMTPPEVVNGRGVRYPVLHPGCIACNRCLLMCPDYCFSVYRFKEPVEIEIGG